MTLRRGSLLCNPPLRGFFVTLRHESQHRDLRRHASTVHRGHRQASFATHRRQAACLLRDLRHPAPPPTLSTQPRTHDNQPCPACLATNSSKAHSTRGTAKPTPTVAQPAPPAAASQKTTLLVAHPALPAANHAQAAPSLAMSPTNPALPAAHHAQAAPSLAMSSTYPASTATTKPTASESPLQQWHIPLQPPLQLAQSPFPRVAFTAMPTPFPLQPPLQLAQSPFPRVALQPCPHPSRSSRHFHWPRAKFQGWTFVARPRHDPPAQPPPSAPNAATSTKPTSPVAHILLLQQQLHSPLSSGQLLLFQQPAHQPHASAHTTKPTSSVAPCLLLQQQQFQGWHHIAPTLSCPCRLLQGP